MNYVRKKLKNGLRIIVLPRSKSLTATVLVLVETGSAYETKEINGISHFLEHLCFKGTKKRPRAIDISGELDSLGSQYNAFTGQEYTGYWAKVNPTHLERVIDVVADIYQNQIFREREIKTESGVIVEEINMYEDDPKRKIFDNFYKLLYGDQPAGWNIAGRKEIVKTLKKRDFLNYRKDHYVAEATVVLVAGRFERKTIFNLLERKFSEIRIGSKKSKLGTIEIQNSPELSLEYKKSDQSHMIIGVRSFGASDERTTALKVLQTLLGGGMSSRLFQVIRERMGAAYYVRAFNGIYTDHGYLAVSVGSDNNRAIEVVRAILKEFRYLRNTIVGDGELKKAKDYIIGTMSLSLETTDELCAFYGEQEVTFKKILEPEAIMRKIRRVTADHVKSIAREIFQNNKLNLSVIGPFKDKKKFEKILKI